MSSSKPKIPSIFKPTGVSFCQKAIAKLEKGGLVSIRWDSENKYDKNALEILNSEGGRCGFVPRKFKLEDGSEIELNQLVKKKLEKLQKKYDFVVSEIYQWDGPTGFEIRFDKKTLKKQDS